MGKTKNSGRVMMTEDLWAQEKQVTLVFQATVDEVGYWRADQMFDEAGLFEDINEDDKLQRALEVARKLGVTLGGECE